LRFLDLSTPAINERSIISQKEILTEAINGRAADMVALPWALQKDERMRTWIRRSGLLLLLRAHPLDMQARYLLHLRSEGKSQRTLSRVYSDLEAAGMLVIMYDYPKGKKKAEILELFSDPPWTIEFRRKFSDSPNTIARYERNLKGFAHFLKISVSK
jgi:hypothetical protein